MGDITRVGTLSIYTNAISNSNRSKANLADLQDQLSSGLKGRTFEAYNGKVEQLTGLQKDIKATQMYIDNNTETITRLNTVEKTLQNTYDMSEDFKKLLALRNNPAIANKDAFEVQAKSLMLTVAKELNVNVSGRYLLGGTNTQLPPVIDNPIPRPTVIGTPDDSFYQGSKQNVVTRVQDNIDLEYDVRADNPAFQKLFAALHLSIEANGENDYTKLGKAQDMVDEALAGINTLTAKVRTQKTNVDNIVSRQQDLKLYYTTVSKEITDADTVAVASQVAIDQATLQATFQIFARISSLNLSQYLN